MNRRERLRALELDRVLILDRGNVELAVPRGWTVAPAPQGHLACKDPTDSCKLEVSYFALAPLLPSAPAMVERVRLSLEGVADPTCSPVVAFRRGRAEFAWTDYVSSSATACRWRPRETTGRCGTRDCPRRAAIEATARELCGEVSRQGRPRAARVRSPSWYTSPATARVSRCDSRRMSASTISPRILILNPPTATRKSSA